MPPRVKNDFYVYLHEDFTYEAGELSDGAFRLHLSALCYAAEGRGNMRVSRHRAERLVPNFKPSQVTELVVIGWWDLDGDTYRILPSPFYMVRRDRETRKSIPKRIRLAVYMRDGQRCVECNATDDLTLDHIVPYSLNGLDTLENLRTLCRSCNSRKGARV